MSHDFSYYVQKVSVDPGETLSTGIASQLAAFGLRGDPSSSSSVKEVRLVQQAYYHASFILLDGPL